jgi:hypothetical protein
MSANNVLTEQVTYSVVINSINKVSGLNNNCTFIIPWLQVLPQKFEKYKIIYNLQTTGGNYIDSKTGGITYSSAKLLIDFGVKSFTYDTQFSGPSNTLGIVTRDIQTSNSSSNCFSAFFYQNCSKTISKPTSNSVNIQLLNNFNNGPLYNTDASGNVLTDMTSWILFLEFIPIPNEPAKNPSIN